MIKKIIVLTISILIFVGNAAKVEANYMYGAPEEPRQIVVDKKVRSTKDNVWYDNLSASDVSFVADDKVDFKILVKNAGSTNLNNIKVVDTLPNLVTFVGSPGTYFPNTRQVEWQIDTLKPGEEQSFEIQTKVVSSDVLRNQSSGCLTNSVNVKAESGESDQDTAQFCVETKILGAQIPVTGFDAIWGILAGVIASTAGIFLKKFDQIKLRIKNR